MCKQGNALVDEHLITTPLIVMNKVGTVSIKILLNCLMLSVFFFATKANAQELLPLSFNLDSQEINWDEAAFVGFEGGAVERIENPFKSGINETAYVLKYTKDSAGQPWGGFEYYLEDFVKTTDDAVFRVKVWSPRADIQARMKLETRFENFSTGDLLADVTVAEEWTQFEWDLSGANHNVAWDMVVIIMDLDTENPPQGGATDTWYLDDFELSGVDVTDGPDDFDDPDDSDDPTDPDAPFAGGSGTETDPYQVETLAHLKNVSGGSYYLQTADIDASEVNFTPLGGFTGEYDGGNHLITNLTIDTSDELFIGLFSVVPGGHIRNLGLVDVEISAPNGEMVGGLTGMLSAGGSVKNVFMTGTVQGWLMVSGIVGHVVDGVIENAYAHAKVFGTVTQNGAVAGRLSANGEVHNAYAVANVTGGAQYGVVVGNNDGGTVRNIYWDSQNSSPAGGIGGGNPGSNFRALTTTQMIGSAAPENMSALDFTDVWQVVDGGYPIFAWQDPADAVIPTSADGPVQEIPMAFDLCQNYPNPFNPTTQIQFDIPEQAEVTLEVFNAMGQRITVLASGSYQAGQHTVVFDATDLASGIYIYRLQAGSFSQTQKMMLVK